MREESEFTDNIRRSVLRGWSEQQQKGCAK